MVGWDGEGDGNPRTEDYIASGIHDDVPPTQPLMKGAKEPELKGEAAPRTGSTQNLTHPV